MKLSKRLIPLLALSLACAFLVLGEKKDTKAFVERNLPPVGVKVYFPTAADFGTVTERSVKTASCEVREKTWGATLHLRMLFPPSNESPIGVFVQYLRITSPTPSLFDMVISSDKLLVNGKTNAELATKPLLVSESLTLDTGDAKQAGALYLLATASEAPEEAMRAVFLPGGKNGMTPTPETECFIQEVAWGAKERYSYTISSRLWKRSTWAAVAGHP